MCQRDAVWVTVGSPALLVVPKAQAGGMTLCHDVDPSGAQGWAHPGGSIHLVEEGLKCRYLCRYLRMAETKGQVSTKTVPEGAGIYGWLKRRGRYLRPTAFVGAPRTSRTWVKVLTLVEV